MASPLIQLCDAPPEPVRPVVLIGGVYRHLDTGQAVVVIDHEYRSLKRPRRSLATLLSIPEHRVRTGRIIVQSTYSRFEKPFSVETESLEAMPASTD